jgi:gamma-glutamylcyclotransferase (GGCT)/AIG2-like uncharacterized protein YtfP
LFGYGLLQPGQSGWGLVAPYATGEFRPALASGSRHNTGLGWPAMLLGEHPDVPGTLMGLRDPEGLLPALDNYEGSDYRRVRVTLPEQGAVAWAYVWVAARQHLRAMHRGEGLESVTNVVGFGG